MFTATSYDDQTQLTVNPGYIFYLEDSYKAKFFGNGLSIGSNPLNHFSVWNANEESETKQRVNFEAFNGIDGLTLSKEGMRRAILGKKPPLPACLAAGYVDSSRQFSGQTWNGATLPAGTANGRVITLDLTTLLRVDGVQVLEDLNFYRYFFTITPVQGNTASDAVVTACIRNITANTIEVVLSEAGKPFFLKVERTGLINS